jgi:hypothetical protein
MLEPAEAAPPPPTPAAAPPATPDPPDPPRSRIGKLIVRYPTFVSSLVVGVAGLIATTIWQYRNFHSQRDTADAQQRIAETQAANSWKIERAEILGKNLQTLAQAGPETADQRYGVLLSLTRAEIIDPELAVSYALELGKVNTEYMQSVLANTAKKDYAHILRAYSLSCEEQFGTSPTIDACVDKLAQRSEVLGELVADELAGVDPQGPLVLFKDERHVQLELARLVGLFETAVTGLYTHRQWDDLDRLAGSSVGAHLVVSMIVASARTGEFVTDDEAKALDALHATHTKWLGDYLMSKSCDTECKGRLIEVMVSHYAESQGDFDAVLRTLLESPHAQASIAVARLHTRLLWCQVDDSDLAPLRDHVLVPAAQTLLQPGHDPTSRDAVLSLIALMPDSTEPAWAALVAQLDKDPTLGRALRDRRAAAARQRQAPPLALRKWNFCTAAAQSAPPAP